MENSTKQKSKHKDMTARLMRLNYLRRARPVTKEELEQYDSVVQVVFRQNYYRYKNFFDVIGYEKEDVMNLLKIHAISFIGHISILNDANKIDEFSQRFVRINNRQPTSEEMLKKAQSDCYHFLKQRIYECANISSNFSKNQKIGGRNFSQEEFDDLLETQKKEEEEETVFTEEESILKELRQKYKDLSDDNKTCLLKNFVEKNKNNDRMRDSVDLANKRLLKL